jgi:regulatory protein
MRKPIATPRPPPDSGSLHAAALAYLARFAATEAGLKRMLARRIESWARAAEAEPETIAAACAQARAAIPAIVARLVGSGVLNDSTFAQSRARSLARAGRSGRAIVAHLAAKGVPPPLAKRAMPANPEQELAAALIHARKRRLGPWRKTDPAPETPGRELASLARAGYAQDIARRALGTAREDAEALIAAFRSAL